MSTVPLHLLVSAFVSVLVGLPFGAALAAEAQTEYFVGSIQASSADGQTPYGPPKNTAIKRVINAEKGTIIETVLDEGVPRTTTLQRRGETAIFDATDVKKTFSGTLKFAGEDVWAPTGWTYDLKVKQGNWRLRGEAKLSPTALLTTKRLAQGDGPVRVKMVGRFKRVDAKTYETTLKRLAAQPKPVHK